MEKQNCQYYPGCRLTQCECAQKEMFEQNLLGQKPEHKIINCQKIQRFDVVDNKAIPIYTTYENNI
jgi:hypothetical protein